MQLTTENTEYTVNKIYKKYIKLNKKTDYNHPPDSYIFL